jgi:hypothetical protein
VKIRFFQRRMQKTIPRIRNVANSAATNSNQKSNHGRGFSVLHIPMKPADFPPEKGIRAPSVGIVKSATMNVRGA